MSKKNICTELVKIEGEEYLKNRIKKIWLYIPFLWIMQKCVIVKSYKEPVENACRQTYKVKKTSSISKSAKTTVWIRMEVNPAWLERFMLNKVKGK